MSESNISPNPITAHENVNVSVSIDVLKTWRVWEWGMEDKGYREERGQFFQGWSRNGR